MASGWAKSLHCKSNALEDVYLPNPTTSSKKSGPLAFSCSSSSQTLRDVVFLLPNKFPLPPKRSQNPYSTLPQIQHQNPKPNPKSKPKSKPKTSTIASPPPSPVSLPTLVDLPPGHSSRRVVEIIFGSSWSPRGAPFPGEIEMLFRVHHPPRSVARFEDHRSFVRSRSDDPRCAADGNEMMRFHSAVAATAAAGAIYNAGVSFCTVGKLTGVRTFAGSGGAHDTTGGGPGRRAMLVCRVIAGRVIDGSHSNSEADSVCLAKGELLVFDPRAVLPCFLIIYKISP
ncbi:hypothetical protein KFK09_008078 [Dendrobium nobile]|uniref:Uncharacterized protein n=1 Tax=Dendrobium nobile TaxID=94219 RepID=A0A8T3BTH3_DENNO|nr:hypothetical protein KFK09_008078 [Dendrobium nobile]